MIKTKLNQANGRKEEKTSFNITLAEKSIIDCVRSIGIGELSESLENVISAAIFNHPDPSESTLQEFYWAYYFKEKTRKASCIDMELNATS